MDIELRKEIREEIELYLKEREEQSKLSFETEYSAVEKSAEAKNVKQSSFIMQFGSLILILIFFSIAKQYKFDYLIQSIIAYTVATLTNLAIMRSKATYRKKSFLILIPSFLFILSILLPILTAIK